MNDLLRSMGVVVAVTLLWTPACGGGSSGKSSGNSTTASAKDAGGADGGGIGPSGPGQEGAPCDSTHKCVGKLNCVQSIFTVGVCGRGCTTNTDCGKADEECFSYSGMAKDGHCVNRVKDEYAFCGVGETSLCAKPLSCLYLPGAPIGVCINTCTLDGSAPAITGNASDADAGTDPTAGGSAPIGSVSCGPTQSCIDNILSKPMANEGVCGMVAKRGEACGIEHGIYCEPTDICAPKSLKDPTALFCFQDCSTTGTKCDKGKCLDVTDSAGFLLFSYCM